MKAARIGFMVLGIVFFMFVIAPYASAQPAIAGLWYKGTASLKGYEIGSQTNILGKDSGKGSMYVNIVADTGAYTVTTCLEDMNTDDIWYLSSTSISTDDVYGVLAEGETMIWDFFNNSQMLFDVGGDGPYVLYPMFTVKIGKSSVSFKSFACAGYNDTPTVGFGLGSCTVSFKSTDPLKVPTGPTRCIRP
ncbi:MAG: hypothetical protein H6Q54_1429 [Deltaproteobacteria bacterium]|jgi:hypothetical protein|nr:hypothetical protein [Deltaproteobacteria bacterium]